MNSADDMTIPNTILSQLGGRRCLEAMTGALRFIAGTTSIRFCFGKLASRDKPNAVTIRLEGSDTYTVTMFAKSRRACKVVSCVPFVYADSLKQHFERETGFYLSL